MGNDNPHTFGTMRNLADVYRAQGALDRERHVLGEDHSDTAGTLYSLGCLSALRGSRVEALDWLGQAVAHGYAHVDTMAGDSDLRHLRGDPAFESLVARTRKNSGTQTPATAGTSPASSASPAGRCR